MINFELGANTANMLTQVPSGLSSTKDAAIFVFKINDRDFDIIIAFFVILMLLLIFGFVKSLQS